MLKRGGGRSGWGVCVCGVGGWILGWGGRMGGQYVPYAYVQVTEKEREGDRDG